MEADYCTVERDARHLLDINSCKKFYNDLWLKRLEITILTAWTTVGRKKCEWQKAKKRKKNIRVKMREIAKYFVIHYEHISLFLGLVFTHDRTSRTAF